MVLAMHATLAAIAAAQGGPFTAAQARAAGYSPGEIRELRRRGVWVGLRRGVYVASDAVRGMDERGWHLLATRAILLAVKSDAVVSHTSAAAVHGLELLSPDWSTLHLTRARAHGSRVEAGVCHHAAELPEGHVTRVGDVPVTSLARTAVDVARISTLAAAVAALDSALHAGVPRSRILEVFVHCAQWPGARDASRAVAFADGRAANPGESLSRCLIAELGYPAPELQVPITDADGLVGVVDFAWLTHGVVGEFDGRRKYSVDGDAATPDVEDVLWREKLREDRLRAVPFDVVRWVWADLVEPARLDAKLRRGFARAAHRLAVRTA